MNNLIIFLVTIFLLYSYIEMLIVYTVAIKILKLGKEYTLFFLILYVFSPIIVLILEQKTLSEA